MHRSVLMMSAVSTWSDPPPQHSYRDTTKSSPPTMPAEDWLLGTAIVLAIVFGASLNATRSVTIVASITASVSLCAALVPWLWAAWLDRRFTRVLTWRLIAASLAVLGAAQLA